MKARTERVYGHGILCTCDRLATHSRAALCFEKKKDTSETKTREAENEFALGYAVSLSHL